MSWCATHAVSARGAAGPREAPFCDPAGDPRAGSELALAALVVNERFARIVLWALAVIVPGGLALLALWTAVRAIKTRLALRNAAPPPPLACVRAPLRALPAPRSSLC